MRRWNSKPRRWAIAGLALTAAACGLRRPLEMASPPESAALRPAVLLKDPQARQEGEAVLLEWRTVGDFAPGLPWYLERRCRAREEQVAPGDVPAEVANRFALQPEPLGGERWRLIDARPPMEADCRYRVRAGALDHNLVSDWVRFRPDYPPPPPARAWAEPAEYGAEVHWDPGAGPMDAVAPLQFSVRREVEEGGAAASITPVPVYGDRLADPSAPRGRVRYRVARAQGSIRSAPAITDWIVVRRSAPPAPTAGIVVRRIAPPAPIAGLRFLCEPRGVRLIWTAPADPSAVHFVHRYSPDRPDAGWEALNPEGALAPTWLDETAQRGLRYRYRVVATRGERPLPPDPEAEGLAAFCP